MKGIACIGLVQPKTPSNIGSILRAAGCYGAKLIIFTGDRFKKNKMVITDPQKFYRQIPLLNVNDLRYAIPFDCVPVAVELHADAKSLPLYKHPKRAFYIFGPEDGTLGENTLSWCRDKVYIPTNGCMNLAAAVNVILYDRLLKGFNL